MRPAVSYCEPWQWQSQPPKSPSCAVGVQPRCVQTPETISHSGLISRLAAVAGASSGRLALRASGSGRSDTGTAAAAAISLGVRRRTNKGWPRNMTVTAWPTWIDARSTSIEASASTAEVGFI